MMSPGQRDHRITPGKPLLWRVPQTNPFVIGF
jgi:hypothetical protein